MRTHAVINAVLVLKHLHPKKSLQVFLRFLQVKYQYGILTILKRLLGSVVVRACVSRFSHMSLIRCGCSGMLRD